MHILPSDDMEIRKHTWEYTFPSHLPHPLGVRSVYIYIWYPPQMSTSFGFDWYLQCFVHTFEYKRSNKKQSTSQFKQQKQLNGNT